MAQRDTQTRIRRLFRKQKKQAEQIGALAEEQFERNLVNKFSRLYLVRRFVLVWLLLCMVLIGGVVVQTRALSGYYQTKQPAAGGIYQEGIIGTYTNSNPLYVTGLVNDAVSKLLYASLFKFDERNKLVGDLAQNYKVDAAGTTYTVHLKPDLTWHDGKPLTAKDVVFTYQTIQNPDAQSPLNVSWQSVTVTALDSRTISFKLSNPLSSFPYSLTTGIIPEHSFKQYKVANFRSLPFNTIKPVGSGPYRFKTIEVSGNSPTTRHEEIELTPFEKYHAGQPAIASFIINTYPGADTMLEDFDKRELTSMVGLQDVPKKLTEDDSVNITRMPLTAANMVFFKTTEGPLSDKFVRQALVGSANVSRLTGALPDPVIPVRSPFLASTPGYDPSLLQFNFGAERAKQILEEQGWKLQPNGIRSKNGVPLSFKLYAQNVTEFQLISTGLKEQWKKIGANAQVYLKDEADLRTTVSGVGGAGGHAYDALLYGISLGVDPDVFVYWHSSQADIRSTSRLNLSEYKSVVADASLADGRTRNDPVLRAIKYRPFLQAWQQDAPALGLYQSRFLYVTRGQVYNLPDRTMTADTDRFNNVEDWMIRTEAKTVK